MSKHRTKSPRAVSAPDLVTTGFAGAAMVGAGMLFAGTDASETKQQPFNVLADLLTASAQAPAAGQLPGSPAAAPFDPFASAQTLMPQYYRMPIPDMTSPYLLTQNAPAGPFARVDAFKGAHALAHGALGRMPRDQLGQPLPGTAPPPGTNIPAGPEQFLPDPALPVPPVPPPPTG